MAMEIRTLNINEVHAVIRHVKPRTRLFTSKLFTNFHQSQFDVVHLDHIPVETDLAAPIVSPHLPGVPVRLEGTRTLTLTPSYVRLQTPVEPAGLFDPAENRAAYVLEGDLMKRHGEARRLTIEKHVRMIENRWEMMAAEAAISGRLTIESDGVPVSTVDFGRDPSLTITKTAGAYWGDTGVSVLEDLEAMLSMVHDASGVRPTFGLLGKNVAAHVRRQARQDGELKDLMDTRFGTDGTNITRGLSEPGEVRPVGSISGLVDLYEYSQTFRYQRNDKSIATFKPLGDNEIALFADDIIGIQAFGAIKNLAGQYAARPIFGRNYIQEGTPQMEVVAHESAPIMIPGAPNRTLKATVLGV